MKTIRVLLLMLSWLALPVSVSAFYSPSTGRWLSRDPIEERGGRNTFGFVNNHPTIACDRFGLVAVGTSEDDDSTTVEGDSVDWNFSEGSGTAKVVVEFDGDTICHSRNVTVIATFEVPGETDPSYQAATKFYCDGTETSPAEGTDWQATKVVVKCKKPVQYCGDNAKDSTITLKGVYDGSPRKPNGSGSGAAKVEWRCNACCELATPRHTTWTFTGQMTGFPSK